MRTQLSIGQPLAHSSKQLSRRRSTGRSRIVASRKEFKLTHYYKSPS
jgi:hypothetical protein